MTKARLREVVEQTVELAKSVATVPVRVEVGTELDEHGRVITVIYPYYQTDVMGGVQEYKQLTLAWVQAVPLEDRRRIMIATGVGVLPS